MKKFLIALALVAGCGTSDQEAENMAAGNGSQGGAGNRIAPAQGGSGLAGLYEGGTAAQPNQLCIVDGPGKAQFGLVVWGANLHSCSGSGEVVREGNRLRLAMAGDQACAIDARMEGDTVTLPATVPNGCSYYCGARARLAGASFIRKGSTVEDAMKAKDLVGEKLCEGLSDAP